MLMDKDMTPTIVRDGVTLSFEAGQILDKIGRGMVLAIPIRGGSSPKLMNRGYPIVTGIEDHVVGQEAVMELLATGLLTKLTPLRNGSRLGWMETNLPGHEFKLYVCTQ